MRLALLSTIPLFIADAALAQAANDTTSAPIREVRAASRALDRALAAGDTATLWRVYATEYVHIDQFGTRSGRAERLAQLAVGQRRFNGAPPVDDEHFAVAGDVVVATAVTRGQQTFQGQPVRDVARMATRVWVKRDGRWQVILAQTTPITNR